MTTVTGKLIGWTAGQRTEMKATLVDATGAPAVGYVESVPGELVRPVAITVDTDGAWTVELTPNADIESLAGDTLWAIQEGRARDGAPIVTYVVVPASGAYWAGDIRADLSDTQTGQSTVVYLPGTPGTDGASAYEVAVANGFVGSEAEWLATLVGPKGDPGSGEGGAVASVNGFTGVVDLDAADVGADPAGAASTAQTAAISAAATDAATRVSAHTAASDPHGDRAAAAAGLAAHESDTTNVHGITNTAVLETTSGSQAKADAAQTAASSALASHVAASDPHGDRAAAASSLATHASDTTDVHGITDTSLLETTAGAQAKADAAQSAAISTAAGDATAKVSAHAAASDPHGDRAAASTALAGHVAASDPHGDRAYADTKAAKAANLGDLASASTARTNLGLGGAAVLSVGTSAGTVAAGDDARITGALTSAGGTITGNLAVAGHALGMDTPAAHGAVAWCYDPALAVNSTQLDNGVLYLVRVNIAAAVTATKIYWWVGNSGSGPVSGQNQVGLYSSAGTLLASATVDSDISSSSLKATTIAGQALTAGSFCWVALLFNASVSPTLTRASGWTGVDTAANLGLSPAAYRFATNGGGRTTLPSSITPASNSGTEIAGPWAAVG